MKVFRFFGFILFFIAILSGCGNNNDIKIIFPDDIASQENRPVIGIAWRPDNDEAFYQYWEITIREAGGYPVHLKQVKSNDNWYSAYDVVSPIYTDSDGMLKLECADILKKNGYKNSNAAYAMRGIDGVFFPGGEDISSTLFDNPIKPLVVEGYSPTRDISDYLLMKYCLDNDVPILGICRGAQMLAVASGASLIQDIPLYCEEIGMENNDTHRMPPEVPDRDFTRHDIEIVEFNSYIAEIVGSSVFENVPSWHHQAILSTEGTPLKVTARNVTNGLDIIEAIERPDKSFVVGVQFHPEYICCKMLVDEELDELCSFDICFRFWTMFVEKSYELKGRK